MDHARHALIVVCLGLLAATAGCSSLGGGAESPTPTATAGDGSAAVTETAAAGTPGASDPTATATPAAGEDHVVTVGGNRTINATLVFERVERLHGVDADRPTVVVGDGDAREAAAFDEPFFRAFGLTGTVEVGGQATAGTEVFLDEGSEAAETVLVHEFAHIVHQQQRWYPTGMASVPYDEGVAAYSVGEGAAEYTVAAYADRFDQEGIVGLQRNRQIYEHTDNALRLFTARYLAGAEYVRSRVSSPSELEPVLSSPPETTEAVLHPDRNVSLGNLTVSPPGESWQTVPGHYPSDADRRGELFVRELLRLELDRPVADAAADGWDNDRSLSLVSPDGDATAVAWTLRWENRTEADEFAAAFDRFTDRRAANSSLTFATERVAPETVTVFAGNETFVEGAAATGTNESVRVVPPGVNGTASAESVRSLASG
ncbi:hypothetical protein [Halosimplex pelagicum]|uniref:Uncharacterized protein n=1 Tax=Halosimplex pelagicum TaxID=869886 RepID=A0A7D5TBZ3_9EURY|nr:hypothetical protein [Halosimplex pelagicum]QLH84170.1 hypothetical protein HZS54_22145 [Halosimplex pelagicum]